MKLSELPKELAVILMGYGDPGVGKSEFLASVNTDDAVMFTDKNGLRTLINPRVKKLYPKFNPDIEILNPDVLGQAPHMFNHMKARIEALIGPKATKRPKWLLIDDMTSIRRAAMNEAVKVNGELGRTRTLSTAKSMNNTIIPTDSDYGTEMGLIETFIDEVTRGCRAQDVNLIMLAHERATYVKELNSEGKPTRAETLKAISPYFTGRAAPKAVVGYFDFCFRLTRIGKGTNIRIQFQCHPDDVVAAKDRDSVFAPLEYDLTIEKVMSRIQLAQLPTKK